jgi:hypothetical protein
MVSATGIETTHAARDRAATVHIMGERLRLPDEVVAVFVQVAIRDGAG